MNAGLLREINLPPAAIRPQLPYPLPKRNADIPCHPYYRGDNLEPASTLSYGRSQMRCLLLVALFVAPITTLPVAIAAAQQRPTQPAAPLPANTGRYQLLSLTVDEQNGKKDEMLPAHELFLLDTQTGKLWKYQPMVQLKDGSVIPEMLFPVEAANVKH